MKSRDIEKQKKMTSMLERFDSSGMSQRQFCEQESITYHVFKYWYKRRMRLHAEESTSKAKFITVEPKQSKIIEISEIELKYPNGVELKLSSSFDLNQIKSLIHLY